jgi:hypothetical protein
VVEAGTSTPISAISGKELKQGGREERRLTCTVDGKS